MTGPLMRMELLNKHLGEIAEKWLSTAEERGLTFGKKD